MSCHIKIDGPGEAPNENKEVVNCMIQDSENLLSVPLPYDTSSSVNRSGRKRRHSSDKKNAYKRRSSFVSGRQTKQLMPQISPDLCKNIDSELPQVDRLSQLVSRVFEHAIIRVNSELEAEDTENVTANMKVDLQKKLTEMQDVLLRSTTKDRYTPNPVNQKIGKSIAIHEEYLVRLKKEVAEWDDMLRERTNSAQECERLEDHVKSTPIEEKPTTLGQDQLAFLQKEPDYDQRYSSITSAMERTVLMVDEISLNVKKLEDFKKRISSIHRIQTDDLFSESFKGMETWSDPRSFVPNTVIGTGSDL